MSDAPAKTSQRRVLVVDDSALVRLYCRQALTKAGFEVDEAISGLEGLEKIFLKPFDLAIVDVNMPGMDGFSFLRSLRRSPPEISSLPVLMVTTEAELRDIEDARAAGANFYLIKPVSEDVLLQHVAALTGSLR